ncbi:MAG: FGGY-family carbohydrate kinase [Aquiluna sp.]|nr:FGGY-family carbohydrate kinase [Aquiluna sp.]
MTNDITQLIDLGGATLGIELGSTRVKACLIGDDPNQILATGSHEWENQLVEGYWTYSLDAVWKSVQATLADLQLNVEQLYGAKLHSLRAMGVSAMMHGYLAFDKSGELLAPFRTWRNTTTSAAAEELTNVFGVNIPLRWSIAHLQQAILDGSEHVAKIDFVTTLAGYVHWKLTGEKVIGIGDASGMFPIETGTKSYNQEMLEAFDKLETSASLSRPIAELLPQVLVAGAPAGFLSEQGALLLDPAGTLRAGVAICPPEGDAGSGMVATNAVAPTTGNVSAGTSIFAMVVLEKELSQVHHELDIVTTPVGDQVAMVHCNNGASELAAWVGMFKRFAEVAGSTLSSDEVYELLFQEALKGEADAGGLLSYNYLAGEPITGIAEGRPVFVRKANSEFNLANAMISQIYGVFGTLSLGMEVLRGEDVAISRMSAHGGIFRTAEVAQKVLSAAISAPVSVSTGAAEGGPWGMALLAAFSTSGETSLKDFLSNRVFHGIEGEPIQASDREIEGFKSYLEDYRAGLAVVSTAAKSIR